MQDTKIYSYIFKPQGKIRGIIQIVHGITEHMGRYQEFTNYCTNHGFIIYGIDLVGHGKSLYQGHIKGYFGKEGSWENVVNDVYNSYLQIKENYPDLPYYLIGFSLGSFIVRNLMIENRSLKINACLLLGTGYQSPILLKMVKFVVKQNGKKAGEEHSTSLIDNLAFKNYNKKFKDASSNADCLLEDKKARKQYSNDPLCLKHVSAGLFRELLNGMIITNDSKAKIYLQCPVYLLSGKNDAVGEFGKGVNKAATLLLKQGANIKKIKLFENMRHDILHGKNCQEVYAYILDIIEKNL